MKEARATVADLTAKAGRADVLDALLEAERRRGALLLQPRELERDE